jgi:uncharacterized membrane protein HdeD (DUF308 family)
MTTAHGPNPLPESNFWFYGAVAKNWRWMASLGGLALLLGVIGLLATLTLSLATGVLFALLLLAGGVVQALHTAKCEGWRSRSLHVLVAVLYVGAGTAMLTEPRVDTRTVVSILGGAVFLVGVLRVAMAWQMRGEPGWPWPLAGGMLAMLLGLMIFAQWPSSGVWVIGLFVSVELLAHGWSMLVVSMAARDARQHSDYAAGR